MKGRIGLGLVLLALLAPAAGALNRDFGLGIVVGEPTGITGKAWLSRRNAFDFAAAWSVADESALHLHGDFLMHRFDLFRVDPGRLPLYYGIGGRIRVFDDKRFLGDDRVQLGLRIPVGLDYLFEEAPFDVFLEVVPILDLLPATDFDLNASLGGRYWFH